MKFKYIFILLIFFIVNNFYSKNKLIDIVGDQKEKEISQQIDKGLSQNYKTIKKLDISVDKIKKCLSIFGINKINSTYQEKNKIIYNSDCSKLEIDYDNGTIYFERNIDPISDKIYIVEKTYIEISNIVNNIITNLDINLGSDYTKITGSNYFEKYDLSGKLISKTLLSHIISFRKKFNKKDVLGKGGVISFFIRKDGIIEKAYINWYKEDIVTKTLNDKKYLSKQQVYEEIEDILNKYIDKGYSNLNIKDIDILYDIIEDNNDLFIIPCLIFKIENLDLYQVIDLVK